MIQISPTDRDAGWPAGAAVFVTLFGPLLELLPPLYWIVWNYESGPFDSLACEEHDDEWLEELFVPLDTERNQADLAFCLLRPAYLPALSRYVYSDWVDIIGLPGEANARKVAERLLDLEWARRGVGSQNLDDAELAGAIQALIENHAEIALHCHDGAWWQLYLRDATWRARAREQLDRLGGLRIEETELEALGCLET